MLAESMLRQVFKVVNLELIFFAEIAKLNTGLNVPKKQIQRILKLARIKN